MESMWRYLNTILPTARDSAVTNRPAVHPTTTTTTGTGTGTGIVQWINRDASGFLQTGARVGCAPPRPAPCR